MAINKKLIHFKNYSDFNSKKLSANETNTAYRLGVDGTVTGGEPDILYQSICWIKDVKKMWTHDTVYDCSGGVNVDFSNYVTQAEFDGLVSLMDDMNADVAALYDDKQDTITDLADIRSGAAKGATAVQPEDVMGIVNEEGFVTAEDLAGVATSGSYNDLVDKPTIPSAVTESTVSGWGFTKNTGTITGVSANGTSVATSGVADIPAATTSKYGVTKLSSATNSTSTSLAATASAVKSAYDLANGRQENLVSGTNIKTINNTSILGSGNIAIDANIQAVDTQETLDDVNTNTYVKYVAQTLTDDQKAQVRNNIGVQNGKEPYTITGSAISFVKTNPMFSKYSYIASAPLTSLSIEYFYYNISYEEYSISFITANSCTLTLPSNAYWANGTLPDIEGNTLYELSITGTVIGNTQYYKAVLVPFKSV